jgi:hypothetical protein
MVQYIKFSVYTGSLHPESTVYAKNTPNIAICSELALTQKNFFPVVSSLSTAKLPYTNFL